MNTLEKLKILGAGAKYDTSCGGDERKKNPEQPLYGIYNAIAYGKCFPMLKVLQTNNCVHDCKYCVNSCKGRERATFEPRELAGVFGNFLQKRYVEGMFLSSAVGGDPDIATERMIETAEIVRGKLGFGGYIHLKALPGTSRDYIERLCELANRVSINVEAPSAGRMNELSSTKAFRTDILRRMGWLGEMKRRGRLTNFTTQFVVGANGESDLEYLRMSKRMYENFDLWRAYFSSFSPVKGTGLEARNAENPMREHALYQADWLLRVYGFGFGEIESIAGKDERLPVGKDLKMAYAEARKDLYPVDVNEAKFSELVRVPGIGTISANRILRARAEGKKISSLSELKGMGVAIKRANCFVTVDGSARQSRLGEY
ncbi:MAG: radical SAM protein [Candidatus Micrarchaeota archaeon]